MPRVGSFEKRRVRLERSLLKPICAPFAVAAVAVVTHLDRKPREDLTLLVPLLPPPPSAHDLLAIRVCATLPDVRFKFSAEQYRLLLHVASSTLAPGIPGHERSERGSRRKRLAAELLADDDSARLSVKELYEYSRMVGWQKEELRKLLLRMAVQEGFEDVMAATPSALDSSELAQLLTAYHQAVTAHDVALERLDLTVQRRLQEGKAKPNLDVWFGVNNILVELVGTEGTSFVAARVHEIHGSGIVYQDMSGGITATVGQVVVSDVRPGAHFPTVLSLWTSRVRDVMHGAGKGDAVPGMPGGIAHADLGQVLGFSSSSDDHRAIGAALRELETELGVTPYRQAAVGYIVCLASRETGAWSRPTAPERAAQACLLTSVDTDLEPSEEERAQASRLSAATYTCDSPARSFVGVDEVDPAVVGRVPAASQAAPLVATPVSLPSSGPSHAPVAMMHVQAFLGTPVAGINVVSHFEVNVLPMQANVAMPFVNEIVSFFTPAKAEQSKEEARVRESFLTSGKKRGFKKSSEARKGPRDHSASTARGARMETADEPPAASESVDTNSDLQLMTERAASILTFRYVRVGTMLVRASFKGEHVIEDVNGATLKLHPLVYHSYTTSFTSLLHRMRKEIVIDILKQAGRNMSNVSAFIKTKFGKWGDTDEDSDPRGGVQSGVTGSSADSSKSRTRMKAGSVESKDGAASSVTAPPEERGPPSTKATDSGKRSEPMSSKELRQRQTMLLGVTNESGRKKGILSRVRKLF